METQHKRSAFSGKLGFVLSAAGASVGLGNIWRFPYLAAKYGGGIFLLIYILLAVTFGYTMIIAETALGRMTRKSPVGAYSHFGKGKGLAFGGWINAVIPILIVPYYSVIGGWVIHYLAQYLTGHGSALASDGYFSGFISNGLLAEIAFLLFTFITLGIIFAGVRNGVERVSKVMMPVLVVLSVVIAVYSVTRPGALAGVKYFLVPNPANFSWMTVVSAMGQMFYSLSIAMGILVTFGSYMKKNVSIEQSTENVEIFDTAIAIMAGLMIIPAVFAFSGGDPDTLQAGPALMFITIPKVFASMGMGTAVGVLFFVLVLFAALTSSIALTESAVSTFEDELGWDRTRSTILIGCIMITLGSLSALGYGPLASVTVFGMQFLDFFDFLTNSVMMPIAACWSPGSSVWKRSRKRSRRKVSPSAANRCSTLCSGISAPSSRLSSWPAQSPTHWAGSRCDPVFCTQKAPGLYPHRPGAFRSLFFKHKEAERNVRGQLGQGGQAGRAIPWRFPVIGGHGEQRLQLPGRHCDAARDFPLPNGTEALIGHLLHRIFIGRVVEDSLHLIEVLCTGHNIDHPSTRAQHAPELFLRKGREAVEQQVGPSGADRLGKAGCHRVFCGRQCLCGQTHRRLCNVKARQLHRPARLRKGLCNAAVVPALAAARIQQVERCICPGSSAVRKAQFPQRPAEDAVIPGVQEGTAGGDHLFAVARGLGAHTLHRQQVPIPLFRPVKAVVSAAF